MTYFLVSNEDVLLITKLKKLTSVLLLTVIIIIIIIIIINYKNNHIGHCTINTENANVKVHNIYLERITIHVSQIVNTEQLQRYIP